MRYIIKLDREGCIGAASCVAANPLFWKLADDSKTNLIDGKQNKDNTEQTREISQSELHGNLQAAQSCPVNAIHIFKKDTNEKLI